MRLAGGRPPRPPVALGHWGARAAMPRSNL